MPFTWTIEYTETARTQLRKLDTGYCQVEADGRF